MFGRRRSGTTTLIGEGAVLEGTLKVHGSVVLEGRLEGTILGDGEVTIGPTGVVRGDIEAARVIIAGRVEGRAAAREHLHVLRGGTLVGDGTYETLEVETGGVIEGRAVRRGSAVVAEDAIGLEPAVGAA